MSGGMSGRAMSGCDIPALKTIGPHRVPGTSPGDFRSQHGPQCRPQGCVVPTAPVKIVERLWQVDRTPVNQVVEDVEDGVRARWAARNEVVHLHHLVAGTNLGVKTGCSRCSGTTGWAPATAVGESTYASARQSLSGTMLRIAGTPPQIAQAPAEISTSQFSRKCWCVSMSPRWRPRPR
jgi:hypothetical protein